MKKAVMHYDSYQPGITIMGVGESRTEALRDANIWKRSTEPTYIEANIAGNRDAAAPGQAFWANLTEGVVEILVAGKAQLELSFVRDEAYTEGGYYELKSVNLKNARVEGSINISGNNGGSMKVNASDSTIGGDFNFTNNKIKGGK